MGVKGLTSYIQKNSNYCMEKCKLHDSTLVIDGDSTAYQLYCNHFAPKNCCFTGDYDRFAMLIKSFFEMLIQCNIKPVLIFDGGYDDRKMNTIRSRMRDRIRIGGVIGSTASTDILFPLYLGELFKDIAVQFNFTVIRCDYEGDLESANIAKALNCPVLSNDSDFYIFGALYIPFSSVKMQTYERTVSESTESNFYISCELYIVEKFLKFIQLNKTMLPLFATLLGNDYIDQRNLTELFGRHINNNKKFGSHKGWRYIQMLAAWLNKECMDSAIEKILGICKPTEKDELKKQILETVDGYICKKSNYMTYINPNNEIVDKGLGSSSNSNDMFLKSFYSNSRKCLYPSCFINMIFQNTYFIRPQAEDHSLQSSHIVSIEIISLINQILRNCRENLRFYTRIQNTLSELLIPICSQPIPTYLEIQEMDQNCRQQLLLNILHINETFVENSLKYFPESWKLYIISIKYMCDKSAINWSSILALILCKLILKYFDEKIGYFRNQKEFMDTYKQKICQILIERSKCDVNITEKSLSFAIENISSEDCLIAQKNFISFFEMNSELSKNRLLFDRKIVHSSSQFQSCFYHIGFLNRLLNSPYEMTPISDCFNGTFIYNMVSYIRKNSNENCVHFLLENATTVLTCLNSITENLKRSIRVHFLPTNQGFDI